MVRPISQDFSSLIGTPYSDKDCWGVVVCFYSLIFNIQLNPYYEEIPKTREEVQKIVYSVMEDFEKIEDLNQLKFGDILLIKLLGFESHIAVYIGKGKILHTQEKTGCVIDSMKRWEKMVVGGYRPKAIND